LSWRRRIRRNLEVLRGSSELDELDELDELELVLLEWTLSNFWTLIFTFLHRSFLLPHLFVVSFLPALGMAACTLKDLRLSQHGSTEHHLSKT
jgi:hypothetical protein